MKAVIKGFFYPAQTVPLLLIVVFSLLLSIASYASLFGIPLALILLSWFFKYAFVLFDGVTLGHSQPPVLSIEMVNPANEQRPLGQLFIVLVYYSLTAWLGRWLNASAITLLRITGLIVLPASTAMLGVTGSLLQAINPRAVFGLMFRLNTRYLAVLIFIAALAALVKWFVFQGFGLIAVSLPLALAITLYGWLALFAMLATVLYDRRLDIGLETWYSPEQTEQALQAEIEKARDRIVDEFYSHWRIGSYANAWAAVQRQIATSADVTGEYVWIHERVARWPDQGMANKIAKELLPKLLQAKRKSEALDIVRARLKSSPDFRPANSAELVSLAQIARDIGDRVTARALLKDFERHFPNDAAGEVVSQLLQGIAR
jgi:hypothetical protein